MATIDKKYKNLINKIFDEGYEYVDPKRDVRCKQIDDYKITYNLKEGFPILTTKKINFNNIIGELLWFLRGDTNIKYLVDNNINIWNKDAYNWAKQTNKFTPNLSKDFNYFVKKVKDANHYPDNLGDLGRVYGAQWRKWFISDNNPGGLDQISNLIQNLKENPMSRRHIVTAWNPAELDDMALPPCHWSFEIIVRPTTRVEKITNPGVYYAFTLKWHQRSVDTYLGLPYNIASYALLAHIIGKLTKMKPLKIIGDLSNVHLYENSWNAATEICGRNLDKYKAPKLGIMDHLENNFMDTFDNFINNARIKDFKLLDYEAYPNVKVEMLAPKS